MKKISFYLCSFLLLVGLISSCSSAPEYGKMIPADAFFVMDLNVEEAVEACDLGDAEVLKKQIDQSLAHAQLPQEMRERLEDICNDPENSGIDFRQPILAFASASFANRYGVIGAVRDADQLEDFLDILRKQGWCKEVMQRDGLRYAAFEDRGFILAFSQDWFFLTQQLDHQKSEQEVLEGIRALAAQEKNASIVENEAYAGMYSREGFLHCLFLGIGLEDVAKEMGFSEEMFNVTFPQGVAIENFGLIYDTFITDGEIRQIAEVKPLTAEAEDWLDDLHENGKLEGDLAKYIPQNAMFYGFANIHGKAICQKLMENSTVATLLAEDGTNKQLVEKVLADLNGDMALAILPSEGTHALIPECYFFAKTEKGTWMDWVRSDTSSLVNKIDDRTFSVDIPNFLYKPSDRQSGSAQESPLLATCKFGMKKDISYVLVGQNPGVLEPVVSPVTLAPEINAYARMNASALLDNGILKRELGPLAFMGFKKVVSLIDYVEVTMTESRKMTWRIVMKNKEQSPVKTVYDEVEKVLSVFA